MEVLIVSVQSGTIEEEASVLVCGSDGSILRRTGERQYAGSAEDCLRPVDSSSTACFRTAGRIVAFRHDIAIIVLLVQYKQ